MPDAQHVPFNGAGLPSFPAAPQLPGAPEVPPSPGSGNGNPITHQGQQPGYVPQTPAGTPPAQTPAPAAPDMQSVIALMQEALKGNTPAGTPPAAPAPAGEKPAWIPNSVNDFDVSTIQDPIIKSMATVLQTVGKDLDLTRVIGKALANGNVSDIDYAYLHEKGGANAQQLAEIAKGIVQSVAAKASALTAEVHQMSGGEAQWNQATAAFNASAPQELKLTVVQMLNSTNPEFVKAGAKIVNQFGNGSGLLPQRGAALLNTAAGGVQGQALSKAEFQAELRKINPDTPGFNEQREALFARRSLGRQVGR
jgi:hypothetical protein